MVVPALIGAAVGGSIVSGVASYFGSKEEARALREAARQGNAEAQRRLKAIESLLERAQAPDFDYRSLTPEEFSIVGEMVPQVASFVAERDPEFVTGLKTEGARQSKEIRQQVLRDFLQQARGEDIQSDIESQQAIDRTLQASRGLDEQVLQSMARRGVAGGGLELAARLAGTQRGTSQLAQAQQAAAQGAAQRRLAALAQSGQLAGDIRGEELGMEQSNVGILNSFNQRNAARMQQQNRYEADLSNQTQQQNLARRQNVADRNVSQRNIYEKAERDRKEALKKYLADFDMGKARTMVGAQQSTSYTPTAVGNTAGYDALSKLGQGITAGGMYYASQQDKEAKSDKDDLEY